MDLSADERLSDSPLVERVWSSRSDQPSEFISVAGNLSELVITKYNNTLRITLRGPETKATKAYGPADAEFLGILFKLGTFIPHLPTPTIVDGDIDLPQAGAESFWLNGSAWEVPTFENADTFINRLVREGLLAHEPVVDNVLQSTVGELSIRSEQRRFLQATGLTYATVRQIKRARLATLQLKQGASIQDTVFEAGYFDQSHLTRSLKRYIGLTPAQIMDEARTERLSFLYNTDSLV
jgi:AraC-like DNA-binding protein